MPVNQPMTILIPAFQAASYLPDLMEKIGKVAPDISVIIVDDGSNDGTGQLLFPPNCLLLSKEKNEGKGAAIQTGLKHIRGGWVLCMDADLQHDPDDLPLFIAHLNRYPDTDLIVGKRRFDPPMPVQRRLSNRLSSFLTALRCRHPVPDVQCGFRAFRLESLPRFNWNDTGYLFETEMIMKALLNGCKVDWIPVSTIYNSSHSHIRPWETIRKFVTLWLLSFSWERNGRPRLQS
ncbi:MAG: glycosyltransferase family 2 protein [Bacteroidetes bacterium]|nr:glycosyltransferase family 2 protein [Bacteroidota bacterium]